MRDRGFQRRHFATPPALIHNFTTSSDRVPLAPDVRWREFLISTESSIGAPDQSEARIQSLENDRRACSDPGAYNSPANRASHS